VGFRGVGGTWDRKHVCRKCLFHTEIAGGGEGVKGGRRTASPDFWDEHCCFPLDICSYTSIDCTLCVESVRVLFAFNSLEILEFAATDCTAGIEGRTVFWHRFPHEGDFSVHLSLAQITLSVTPLMPPDIFKNIKLLPLCMTGFQKRVSALLLNAFISFN